MSGYRRILRNRALVRLLVGETVSSIGDWLYLVAILVVVYQATEDPLVLGIVGAIRMLPYVVLSVPAGIAADRFDRRQILIWTDVARGVLMLVLAAMAVADAPVVAIVAVTVLATTFATFFGPAIGAYLPTIVGDESDLGTANSLWATLDNLAFFIGPAVAGLLIALGGLDVAFVINAVSFFFVAAVLVGLPPGRPGKADEDGEAEAAGDTPVIDRRALLGTVSGPLIVDAATSFAGAALNVLIVLIAIDQLGAGEEAVGYLQAATGVGGVVAGIIAGWFVTRRLGGALIAGGVVGAIGIAALGLTTSLPVALVLAAIALGAVLILDIAVTTLMQRMVPDAALGRAMGMLQLTGVLAALVGSVAAPGLVAVVGLGAVLVVTGALQLVAAAVAVVILARQGALSAPKGLDPVRIELLRRTILAGAPAARLESAARAMRAVPVRAGDVVIRQGDEADVFYLIEDGRFAVSQAGPDGTSVPLRELSAGDPFGEIGLLTGSARTATVTAVTEGRLLVLDRDRFLDLVSTGPDLRAGLLGLYGGLGTVR